MKTALTWLRATGTAIALSGMFLTSGVVMSSAATAQFGQVTATTSVNIRSGPGTTFPVQSVLSQGQGLTQIGNPKNGFTPVSFKGGTGWISTQYLRGTRTEPTDSQTGTPSAAVTTAALNVRSGAGTGYSRVGVLPLGTTVALTGRTTAGWSQITFAGRPRWVSTAYLAAPGTTSDQTPPAPITGKGRATTALMIRTTADVGYRSLGDVPAGTLFDLTGVQSNGMAQIVWQGVVRWVNGLYVAPVGKTETPVAQPLPKTIATRYVTAALTIRTGPEASATALGDIPAGTALPVTGVVKNGRAEIIYQGAVRWVTAQYLSATAPAPVPVSTSLNTWKTLLTNGSSGLTNLTGNAKGVVDVVLASWPQVRTIYGVRADAIPDHPSGRAVDLMLPNYRTNSALGWQMAKALRARADELKIQYIIFDQQIWNRARDAEGWRPMANRGSDTANHRDHVHVTVMS